MSFLKSLKKLTKSPLGRLVGKAIKATPVGGKLAMAAEKVKSALRTAKNAGQLAKAARLKIEPMSVRSVITKNEVPSPGKTMPAGPAGIVKARSPRRRRSVAARMKSGDLIVPSGVAEMLQATTTKDARRIARRANAIASGSPRKPKRKAAKPRASTGKRKAPTGGKDFKALSASWRAAGKPGTWLAWVKAN